jgi:peptidoglycan/LPS O-acetylase OafA/YrhL
LILSSKNKSNDEYFASFFIVPGSLAVWIFFMMSGYLVGHGLIYGRYQQTFKDIRRF